MRPISWIHISDFHIRESDAWSQDVILKATCEDFARQGRENTIEADFILVTGDLAFSGKPAEYALATDMFGAISTASCVPKERIFCVPGNHDIDRDRQKFNLPGAQASLQNQSRTDVSLSPDEELETLLGRQEAYRDFQATYFKSQDRVWTDDALA